MEVLNQNRDLWEEVGSQDLFSRLNNSFLKIPEIRKQLRMIERVIDNLIISERGHLLDCPFWELSNITYEDFLNKIFKRKEINPYRKRIGKAIERYGTRVINNLHEKRIWSVFFYSSCKTNGATVLKDFFSIQRIFKLMTSEDDSFQQEEFLHNLFAATELLKMSVGDCSFLSNGETFGKLHESVFRNEILAILTDDSIDQKDIQDNLHGKSLSGGHYVFVPQSFKFS